MNRYVKAALEKPRECNGMVGDTRMGHKRPCAVSPGFLPDVLEHLLEKCTEPATPAL